jgi:hypothetical protein
MTDEDEVVPDAEPFVFLLADRVVDMDAIKSLQEIYER